MNTTSSIAIRCNLPKDLLASPADETGHLEIDSEHYITFVDATALRLFGYSKNDLVQTSVWDILCEKIPAIHHRAIQAAFTFGSRHIIRTRLRIIGTNVLLSFIPRENGTFRITIAEVRFS